MAAVDFNAPDNDTDVDDVLGKIRDMFNHVMTALFTSDTNVPTGTVRINSTTGNPEKWNGSSWDLLTTADQPGDIKMTGRATAQSGWLLCQGQAVSRSTYAALFTAIGTAYGTGDGSTTFNVPNLQQRMPLGKAASGTGNALGATGGAIDHTHTGPNHAHSLAHTHTIAGHYHGKGTLNITDSGGHSHAIKCATGLGGGTTQFTNANQTVAGNNLGSAGGTETAVHLHDNAYFAGSVGATAGSNGDSAITTAGLSAATTGNSGTDATGTNNPPFVVVNFIIKT